MEKFINGGCSATIHYTVSYCVLGESKKTTVDFPTSSIDIEREKICVDSSTYLTRLKITNTSGTMVKLLSAYPIICDDLETEGVRSENWEVFNGTRQLNDVPGACVLGAKDSSYAECVNRMSEEGAPPKDYKSCDSVLSGDLITVIKAGKKYISLEILTSVNCLNDISISNDCNGSLKAVRIGGEFNCLMENLDVVYTDWVRIKVGGNFIRTLEDYANARKAMSPGSYVSEDKPAVYRVEKNINYDRIGEVLTFIKGLKAPFEYIELGCGWQSHFGDWEEKEGINLNLIANQINLSGYMAGIWTAPFLADKESELCLTQKSWILRHADGSACTYRVKDKEYFVLDISSPECLEHLEMTYLRLSACGFYHHTIDYLSAFMVQKDVILQDPTLTLTKAYTRAVKTIKNAIGDNGYLSCDNSFLSPLSGIADSVQVVSDIDVLYEKEKVSVIPKMINQASMRGYLSPWWNNKCSLMLKEDFSKKYSPAELRNIMVLEYLTGGMPAVSDISSNDELKILRCIFPAVNLKTYPRETFDDDTYIKVVDVEVNDDYHTLCFFNHSFADVELIFRLDNKTCGGYIDHSSRYNVSSYFGRKSVMSCEYDDIIKMGVVPANSCEIVKIAKNNKPRILLSDMHFSMGGEVTVVSDDETVIIKGNNKFNCKGTYVVALGDGIKLKDGKEEFSFTVNGEGPFEYKKSL